MKINKYNFLLLFFLIGFVVSCKTTETKSVKQDSKPLQNALLWKIESENLPQTSYLFGTIHIIDSNEYFLPAGFQEAFDTCETVVFEIDMNKMNDPAAMMKLLPKIMMKGDTSLKDLLTKEDYILLQQHLKKNGIPIFLFEKVKPLFLSMFAEDDIGASSLESGKYISYEMEFMKMAKEKNKEIAGLETMEYQISVLDSIPYKEQANMLMESLKSDNDSISQMKQLITLYKQQNINALHQSIQADDISKYEKILLNNRNKNWIPVMIDFMIKKPTFFAVGAGHLGGNDGIIKLLRKKGYKVSPVLQ